ncbi:hypothetical protein [Paenarthrobacter sp. JL.01a]|uniref:hypothetical protein n=1 Tax=Paenarthrobacter sp. JL.01a TaxID=2979324 RepID=UPI002905760F|nr:hypothetical protein [Paenarthrobacter sp. JL.01a]
MTGISFSGNPGTSALTVAVAFGSGVVDSVKPVVSGEGSLLGDEALPVGDTLPDGDGVEVDEDAPDDDGAAEPPVDGVHAEAATATLTASRANPRD